MQLPEHIMRAGILRLSTQWPTLVPPLLDALSLVVAQQPLPPAVITSVREALSGSRVALYETASYLTADASVYDANALELVLSLSRAPKAHERRNAILCLTKQTPQNVALNVLGRGLVDTSSRVRTKAADWILRLRLAPALPPLEAALSCERHRETRNVMKFTFYLLRDGYLIRPSDEEKIWLTTLDQDGSICSESVERTLVERLGIERVVATLKGSANAA